MKTYDKLVDECRQGIDELFPWDLVEQMENGLAPVILDVREPYEFQAMHIKNSINIPRGILESACEYGYEETIPEVVESRDRPVVLVCRSGNRSVLAAWTLRQLGYKNTISLKTGLRGWNDYEQPLVDQHGDAVKIEIADEYFAPKVKPEQMAPK